MSRRRDAGRRFYRLRAPDAGIPGGTAVSVRVGPEPHEIYLAIGTGNRRVRLTPEQGWALWRCLSEAMSSTGAPPDWIRVNVPPT